MGAPRILLHASVVPALLLSAAIHSPAYAACDTSICGTSPCTITGTHTIDSGCVLDFGSKDVTLTGTLNGDNNAECYTIRANSFTLRGTLRARGSCVIAEITGNFKTEIVSGSAALVDVRNADSLGDGFFLTCGSATLDGRDINADADGDQTPLYYPAGDILIGCTGDVTGSGGPFHANATGGDDGGSIDISSSTGDVNLASAFEVHGGGSNSYGGSIVLNAGDDLTAGASGKHLLAYSAQGGIAGGVDLVAEGDVIINGNINADGNGDASDGGAITVSGATASTGTQWTVRGDQSGYGGSIDVEAFGDGGTGTIATASTANFLATGSGGGDGGSITLTGTGSITLEGDMDTAGQGELTTPGTISVTGGDDSSHTIWVKSTSRLEADGSGTDASNGAIELWACNLLIDGVLDTRNTALTDGFGTNSLTYSGTLSSSGGSSLLADDAADGGANDVYCRCVDVSPADGTCDSPATCASSPTLSGTVTPAATLYPLAMPACT